MNTNTLAHNDTAPASTVVSPAPGGEVAQLSIRAISSHGIKVATRDEEVMTVPWNVMRALARDGKAPYATLFAEAQATMLGRLGSRRKRTPVKPAHPMRRATDRREVAPQANGNQADLPLTVSANDSRAEASIAKQNTITLTLPDMPRELVLRARAKGRASVPPISLKWAVRLLLEDWVKDGGRSR